MAPWWTFVLLAVAYLVFAWRVGALGLNYVVWADDRWWVRLAHPLFLLGFGVMLEVRIPVLLVVTLASWLGGEAVHSFAARRRERRLTDAGGAAA